MLVGLDALQLQPRSSMAGDDEGDDGGSDDVDSSSVGMMMFQVNR